MITRLSMLLLVCGIAQAFPPAPGFTISRNARNQFGWVLEADSGAVVIVKQNGAKVAEATVGTSLVSSQNFQVVVPMDPRPSDAYAEDAYPPGVQFTLEVKLGSTIYPITDLKVTEKLVAEVGGKVSVDFSIAEDSDGDGIPDSWEFWQLGEAGIVDPDPRYSLDTFSRNGDFDGDGTNDRLEYLAGTFAFLSGESLRLKIKEETVESEWISFETFVVTAKKYQVEVLNESNAWDVVPVRVAGETETRLTLTADDTRELTIQAARVEDAAKRIFRLKVQ